MYGIHTEQELIATCLAILGSQRNLSTQEKALAPFAKGTRVGNAVVIGVRNAFAAGMDPLGEVFSSVRSRDYRRSEGAVYTPAPIVRSMVGWLRTQVAPARIVDAGAGSGRFIVSAAVAFPNAQLIAVERDPVAALTLRANLCMYGLLNRCTVLVQDYRNVILGPCHGATAFVGNPPYVRHHNISENWKAWYAHEFAKLGIRASALAGLHLHFFLKTHMLAQPGDFGALITSAEWLDVNYGSALRRLLVDGLGGVELHVLEPTVAAFPGTATTAAISCFHVGETRAPMRVRAVRDLKRLNGLTHGALVARAQLRDAPRWSPIIYPTRSRLEGVELGELFRVHRGQVTGANDVWIADQHADQLPVSVKIPAVTRAKDLINAGAALGSDAALRRVINLPDDLEGFAGSERKAVTAFLAWAKQQGADQGYIARHRKAWWSVGLREPAPILCTYMARRPPQFTLNICGARHINIAHGLYPRQPMSATDLRLLVTWLNDNVSTQDGRTYAGGLTKFEPKEIERLRVPRPEATPA